jgi:hypothetical protein
MGQLLYFEDYLPHKVFRSVCFVCCNETLAVQIAEEPHVHLECSECGHFTSGIIENGGKEQWVH